MVTSFSIRPLGAGTFASSARGIGVVPLMKFHEIDLGGFPSHFAQVDRYFKNGRRSCGPDLVQAVASKLGRAVSTACAGPQLSHHAASAGAALQEPLRHDQEERRLLIRVNEIWPDLLDLDVIGILRLLASDLCESSMRKTDLLSQMDSAGRQVLFPAPQRIEPQLKELSEFLSRSRPWTWRTGAVAMNALYNLHPLTDGNGRAGRLVFNRIAQGVYRSDHYLPLAFLNAFSGGAYLRVLRGAQYRAEWEPLLRMINEFARFCAGRL